MKVVHQIDVVENNRFEGEQPPEKIEFLYKKKGNAIENTTHTDIFQLLFFFFFLQILFTRAATFCSTICAMANSEVFINTFAAIY